MTQDHTSTPRGPVEEIARQAYDDMQEDNTHEQNVAIIAHAILIATRDALIEAASLRAAQAGPAGDAREALQWIADQRYADRETFHEGNAFEVAKRMNTKLIEICERARAALTAGAGQ